MPVLAGVFGQQSDRSIKGTFTACTAFTPIEDEDDDEDEKDRARSNALLAPRF
jgi:hypothetical protein